MRVSGCRGVLGDLQCGPLHAWEGFSPGKASAALLARNHGQFISDGREIDF